MLVERDERIREMGIALEEREVKVQRMQEEIADFKRNTQAPQNNEATTEEGFNAALKTHLEENMRIKEKINAKNE